MLALLGLLLLLVLNRRFYALLLRRGGPLTFAAGVLLHALHHLTAVAAVPLGVAAYLGRARASGEAGLPAESG
jgi:hypothetical protein